jgi:hypothetical protein
LLPYFLPLLALRAASEPRNIQMLLASLGNFRCNSPRQHYYTGGYIPTLAAFIIGDYVGVNMKSFKNKIILFLSLDLALLSILMLISFFNVLPLARSAWNILKITWFLLFIALIVFFKGAFWKYKPRSIKGQFGGFKWVANISYNECKNVADIEIHWLCPMHKVFLQSKESEASDSRRHALFCPKCNRTYNIKIKNDFVPFEEAQIAIKQDILFKVDN